MKQKRHKPRGGGGRIDWDTTGATDSDTYGQGTPHVEKMGSKRVDKHSQAKGRRKEGKGTPLSNSRGRKRRFQ